MTAVDDMEVELTYTDALLRRVVRRWWLREVGPFLAIGLIGLGGPTVDLAVHGDRSWLVGVFSAFLFAVVYHSLRLRALHLRHARQALQRLPDGRMLLRVSEQGLTFDAPAHTVLLRWNALSEIRTNPDHWMLFRARNDFSIVPLGSLSNELQRRLLGRFRDAGVQVR